MMPTVPRMVSKFGPAGGRADFNCSSCSCVSSWSNCCRHSSCINHYEHCMRAIDVENLNQVRQSKKAANVSAHSAHYLHQASWPCRLLVSAEAEKSRAHKENVLCKGIHGALRAHCAQRDTRAALHSSRKCSGGYERGLRSTAWHCQSRTTQVSPALAHKPLTNCCIHVLPNWIGEG